MNQITTLSGKKASILGLGSNTKMDYQCIFQAYQGGINYFFFYNLDSTHLINECAKLAQNYRQEIIIATGSEQRNIQDLDNYRINFCQQLNIKIIDVFLLEYISFQDDVLKVEKLLNQLHDWKKQGLIRYFGITTHDRDLAVKFLENSNIDILMHRYNMAHRQPEKQVFPTAIANKIPVISFTATRWGSLLKGDFNGQFKTPKAIDCYRFVLQNSAISLTLTSPKILEELNENLAIFNNMNMNKDEYDLWQKYGDLIYGEGNDSFETQWL
ncbi:aldo/keto reductase [Geminocystis sp. NIES-3709]|uniref:aldo/keto reductase n=1 Tax=Geminocystis sp. NIES-3709 TaxID=1617448 RepID=UPI0005FCBD95|nr:aldo/keto reductase [Geminocystis sp. NIES-3709]BAQ66317.1 aldo-keto reductase [Geminocystis sp. NIES-3709]